MSNAHIADPIVMEIVNVETMTVTSGRACCALTISGALFPIFLDSVRVRNYKLLDSKTHTAKFHNVSLGHFDRIIVIFQWMAPILNLFHRGQLFGLLVLESYDLPSLLKMAVLVIELTIRLVQRLCVIDPICTTFVHDREKHLV